MCSLLFTEKRNKCGDGRMYIGKGNKEGYKFLKSYYKEAIDYETEVNIVFQGMNGRILLSEENVDQGG